MQKIEILVLLMLMLIAVACDRENSVDGLAKRYKIESAVIEYQVSGAQSGTETLYFDRWGMREATYSKTEISMMGFTQKTNTLKLLDGKWTYNIDLDKRTGIKVQTPFMQQLKDKASNEDKDMTDIGKEMMIQMGGKQIGSETVAGKPCEVWRIDGLNTSTWIYQGLTLKVTAGMADMEITKTAIHFEENVEIDPSKFAVPADVKIGENQQLQDALKRLQQK